MILLFLVYTTLNSENYSRFQAPRCLPGLCWVCQTCAAKKGIQEISSTAALMGAESRTGHLWLFSRILRTVRRSSCLLKLPREGGNGAADTEGTVSISGQRDLETE